MALAQIEQILIFIARKLIDLSCKVHALPYNRVRKDHCCFLASIQLTSAPRVKSIILHSSAWLWVATHWLVWTAAAINNGLGVKFFIHLVFIIVTTTFFVNSLEITFHPDGLQTVQNGFEEMQSYFKRRWAYHPVAYLFTPALPCLTVAIPSVYAAIYLWDPTLPMFFTAQASTKFIITHVFAEGMVEQVIRQSIGASVELVIMFWITIAQAPIHQSVLMISVSLPMWLTELRERVKNASRRGPWHWSREVQHCLKLYSILRMFNILGNDFIGRSILPAIPAFQIAITSGCLFCTIRLHDVLPLLLYALFPALALFAQMVVIPGFGRQMVFFSKL